MSFIPFTLLLCMCLFSLALSGISRETKQRVSETSPQVKQTILGLQAQGVPKEAIAEKIKMSVSGDTHSLIDGVNYEAKKSNSPAAKQTKAREQARNQAIKAEERKSKRG